MLTVVELGGRGARGQSRANRITRHPAVCMLLAERLPCLVVTDNLTPSSGHR